MLKFITGNKKKFIEAAEVLKPLNISQININLDEIQELDVRKIIKHKLNEAFKHHKGLFIQAHNKKFKNDSKNVYSKNVPGFIVEDSALYLDCLGNKLPGPLIKWFLETSGVAGLYQLAKKFNNYKAHAVTVIGYAKNPKDILFFEGRVNGKIAKPKGSYKFGYDLIFIPDGSDRTLSETKAFRNFNTSPRGLAVKKLKKYLVEQINYGKK